MLIAQQLSWPYSGNMKNVLSERLKSARQRARLTQDDVAEACRNPKTGEPLSKSAIAQWEKSDGTATTPELDNLIAAAKRMGTSLDYLVGLVDSNEKHSLHKVEESANYYGLTENAVRIAKQWQSLPTETQLAVQNMIESILKLLANKR